MREKEKAMTIEMKIKGLMIDPITNMPIVILKDAKGKKILPIWVGLFEANSIALEIEKVSTPRPMTHDLLKEIITRVDGKVEKIVVTELKDNTYYALIHVQFKNETLTIDSRPSDAIALALRTQAPIFVSQDVIEKAKTADFVKDPSESERLKKWFENLDPEELNKFKM